MILDLIFVFWFFAPAGVANIAAFFSSKIPYIRKFSYPVDGYAMFRKKRVLGDHKTIRGFVCGVFAGIGIVYLQIFLYNNLWFVPHIISLDYNTVNPIFLGSLAGFGALAGDAVKSFFKRQMGIKPGVSWVPFDQIDYIVGGILFTSLYIALPFWQYVFLFFVWFFLHPFTSFLGYLLKFKNQPL
jgi:CDP-2,3-bis-(O-geranylgeranyl)-sn-glycerol synthase